MTEWTKQDSLTAGAQGWNVFDVWERHWMLEIQREDDLSPFPSDEAAREFVRGMAIKKDELCAKAVRLVFVSKCGVVKGKKK